MKKSYYLYDCKGELHILSKKSATGFFVCERKSIKAVRNAAYKYNNEIMFYVYDQNTVEDAMKADGTVDKSNYIVR